MVKEISRDTKNRMEKVIEDFRHKLATVRTGRASTSLLDNISVEYYGSPTPLNQVATIHAPEASMLTVQPFDPSDQRYREGSAHIRTRSQPVERRQTDPHPDPPAHRRAP